VTTPEQSARLYEAIKARHGERGWVIGSRQSASSYYAIQRGGPVLYTALAKWDRRMQWVAGSAEAVAVDEVAPTTLESRITGLRAAVESRCAERGWVPANRLPEGLWESLRGRRLPGLPEDNADAFLDAVFDALAGDFPDGTRQALVDLDTAVEWELHSAERLLRDGTEPRRLEGDHRRVVIELDTPPGAATVDEWYQIAGRATASAPQMSEEDLGRMSAVLQRMLDDWQARQGR